MFKWKVSGLGGGSSKKSKSGSPEVAGAGSGGVAKLNNGQSSSEQEEMSKNAKNNKKDNKSKDKDSGEQGTASTSTSPNPVQKGFRLFSSNSGTNNNSGGSNNNSNNTGSNGAQPSMTNGQTHPPPPNGILKNNYDKDTMSRVGQRLAMTNIPPPAFSPGHNNNNNNVDRLRLNLSTEQIFNGNETLNTSLPNGKAMQPPAQPPPLPPSKPGWRPQSADENEEAIPNDSLYANNQDSKKNNGSLSWRDKQFGSRPSLNGMAHWSSHGYLAKAPDGTMPSQGEVEPSAAGNNGYVVLKRQGDQIVTMRQPQSLPNQVPPPTSGGQDGDRKYFSVKGFTDMNSKHNQETETSAKYLSVDARYNSMKNLPPDIRMKLRENLRLVHEQQQQQLQQQQRNFGPYQAPPPPPSYPFPPAPPPRPAGMKPAPPPRQDSVPQQPQQPQQQPSIATKSTSNLESSKQMSNSVSWLEWTQQLQAYIAWVNSQLRKRSDLRPVQDLRTDLQSGEVLAQLIEIISGEKIAGIEYNPESLQGMRDNLDRILQFMAGKRIRMHHITSKEILEGNLKAVMRLILALAAHYKPQSVRHHDVSYENLDGKQPQQQQQQNEASKTEGRSDMASNSNLTKDKSVEIHSPLNRTQDSIRSVQSMTTQTIIKRSPSMNENHYSPVATTTTNIRAKNLVDIHKKENSIDNSTVYENVTSNKKTTSATMTTMTSFPSMTSSMTEKNAISTQTENGALNVKPVLQKEGSFVRTGSGRKLPKIPDRNKTQTLPTNATLRNHDVDDDDEDFMASSGDKAEHRKSRPKALEFWETLETVDSADFRYNTIHRMSMGRRMLPKPPPNSDSHHQSHARSLSLDRSVSNYHDGKESLNSSFSENEKMMRKDSSDQGSVPPSPRPGAHKKIPPDGCSLQSSSSSGGAAPGQPSPPSSSDTRGEVEGSSDNNSPPTSVIQGTDPNSDPWDNGGKSRTSNPAFDWIRGAYGSKSSGQMFRSLEEEVAYLRAQRIGDGGNSSGKVSDSECGTGNNIPYEVLIQDLTQAKRQLLELHSLECANLQGSKLGLESRLAEQESNLGQLKQDLLRTTLAKQTLEFEKKELLRRIDELERTMSGIKSENGEKDKLIRAHKLQLEEMSRRNKDMTLGANDSELKALYDEELAVAKDAISNLRTSFRDADPSQHILDTLEQCISVIIEKIQRLDQEKASNSRMSSLEYNRANEGLSASSQPQLTKILYFTNRSVTPFMSTIYKKIGEITLRDFKILFDRPGFYRFHFKTVDQEFGMVKEEISNDDAVLPGSDGKVVAWVEED